jgi:hypothetical protein
VDEDQYKGRDNFDLVRQKCGSHRFQSFHTLYSRLLACQSVVRSRWLSTPCLRCFHSHTLRTHSRDRSRHRTDNHIHHRRRNRSRHRYIHHRHRNLRHQHTQSGNHRHQKHR